MYIYIHMFLVVRALYPTDFLECCTGSISSLVYLGVFIDVYTYDYIYNTWNPKQPFINDCFNWMIPNLYIENGCFTKHPFINGCLGFQARYYIYKSFRYIPSSSSRQVRANSEDLTAELVGPAKKTHTWAEQWSKALLGNPHIVDGRNPTFTSWGW